MPFIDHLAELRTRLAISLGSIAVLAGISFIWATQLFAILTRPLVDGVDKQVNLIGTGPAEAFIVKLKVALGAGIVLAAPILFYQLWKFVAPGLLDKEKRYALPFVVFTSFFFLLGISFCYNFVLPFAFDFFLDEFLSIGVSPDIRIGEYLTFTLRILLVFGLVFELPILSFFGAVLGIVSSTWLREKGRMAVVVIFVCAAILTPPDVVTQCLLAVPLIILYLLCIWIAARVEKHRKTSEN
ncbi:UNVERIFIED_CONTAM: hypothetical protein GTU68_048599 [Idotea baltica]|nr:hypothetical protein [Idotea baltica]